MLLENNSQEQLIFKHAISTVVSNRGVMHSEHRPTGDANRHWSDFGRHSGVCVDCGAGIAGGSGLDWQWSRAGPAEWGVSRSARSWLGWILGSGQAANVPAWRVRGRVKCAWKSMHRETPHLKSKAPVAPPSPLAGLDAEESLAEFRELVSSAGGQVAAELLQRRPRPDPATLIGSGKVEEIAGVAASTEADLVLFDHDLSPTQLRNLEAALPCRVLDRTQLILDIFARHARTREGQLQVELAQLEYMLPRLTGKGKSMSQLGGGIGTRGPGETQLETDRRQIQRRIDQLKLDLDAVRRVRKQQRQRRESVPVPTVALVGYTNAGKSTLFNCLTGAGGAAIVAHVCDARSETAGHRAAQPPQGSALRYGRLHPQPSAHAGHQLPRHAGRGGAGRGAVARARCRIHLWRGPESAGRESSGRAGSLWPSRASKC